MKRVIRANFLKAGIGGCWFDVGLVGFDRSAFSFVGLVDNGIVCFARSRLSCLHSANHMPMNAIRDHVACQQIHGMMVSQSEIFRFLVDSLQVPIQNMNKIMLDRNSAPRVQYTSIRSDPVPPSQFPFI